MTNPIEKENIKNLAPAAFTERLGAMGIKSYRCGQVFRWIYGRGCDSFFEMTDIARDTMTVLAENFVIEGLCVEKREESEDGSVKYRFRLKDSHAIESVLIPERNHRTLCISSQVGCALGCRFCLTGKNGFVRNLELGEITSQVQSAVRDAGFGLKITNIVFMGMGEPFLNYANVADAVKILTDSKAGLGFSRKRITVSTAGVAPRFQDFAADAKAKLAVSLNAADDRTRSMLMPVNEKWPLKALLEACARFPLKARDRITYEYILIKGINDSEEDAGKLTKLLNPKRSKINLIPFNEHRGCDFERSGQAVMDRFREILHNKNFTAIIRKSRGRDISAACGQLAGEAQHLSCSE